MQRIICIIFLCTSLGCSLISKQKQGSLSAGDKDQMEKARAEKMQVQQEFNNALALLDVGKYNQAGRAFKNILKKYPNTDLELLIVYNLGGALEGLKKCDLAVRRYRQVVQRSAGKFPKLEANALLRMSYSYECLGDDAKAVATLIDLQKRGNVLGKEVVVAEIPARLAAAYSRLGNDYLAQSYFIQAQEGLREINSDLRSPGKKKELLAKTLFHMGNMQKHSLEKMGIDSFIESQRYLQNYLLMSVEMNDTRWSPRSAEEILATYEKIYKKIQKEEPKTANDVKIRQARSRQLELLQGAISNIKNLRLQRFSERDEPRILAVLFDKIKEKEKTFEIEMARVTRGTNLTKEALEREALKLPGRVLEERPHNSPAN